LGIQIEIGGEFLQVVFAESTLIFTGLVIEKVIMIFPESALIACAFAGFGCPL
jgi:hypothetical protein